VNDLSLQRPWLSRPNLGLASRLAILAIVFFLEKLFLDRFVDYGNARVAEGLGATVRLSFHWGSRVLVALAACIGVFALIRGEQRPLPGAARVRDLPIRPRWVLVHLLMIAALVPLSALLFHDGAGPLTFVAIAAAALLCALAAGGAALLAMAPRQLWVRAARNLGSGWLYGALAAVVGVCIWQWSLMLWAPTAAVTFDLVQLVLSPLLPALSADPENLLFSTDHFAVQVTQYCSGLEGVGFMLAFGCAWLLYYRKEYIFPNALLLLPAGVLVIFALNVLRIATLFLIGNSGFVGVASYGFHSQAGWIAFVATACVLAYTSRRSTWLSTVAVRSAPAGTLENPTAAYLLPLLAILGSGILARAASSGFETLYPLRLIAGACALWLCRNRWAQLDWRCSWRAPAIGALIFLLWILAAHFLVPTATMPAELAEMSPAARCGWIACRVLAAVLTVPLAEELAYRAYLLRRVVNDDFESVRFQSIRWPALMASAVIFGVAHGALWLPGIIAGLAYGWLLVRTGRIGEAVAAHAITNSLIAALVLFGGQWQLW
jgi:exosortase E/protease (VPEID-CTERM system)